MIQRAVASTLYKNYSEKMHDDSQSWGLRLRSYKAWNSLPSELRCIAVDSTFSRRLKMEPFSRAYGVSINI